MTGKIKRLILDRGFGFIRPHDAHDHRHDHFFHFSELSELVFSEALVETAVQFDSTMNEKGLTAVNVRPLKE